MEEPKLMMYFSCPNSIPESQVRKAFAAAFGFEESKVDSDFDRYPNLQAVLVTQFDGNPRVYCATLPNSEYPTDYPADLKQRRSYSQLARIIGATVFYDPPVLDKYDFPAASFAVSPAGQIALAFDNEMPETYLPVEFDPAKANSVWLDPAENIVDIVFARRTRSGHIILMDLEGFPTRLWLSPNDYLRGVKHLITDLDGRFKINDIQGSYEDRGSAVTLQEISDETDWDPALFSPGW